MAVVQCDLIKLHTAPHSVVQFTITCGAVQLLHFKNITLYYLGR